MKGQDHNRPLLGKWCLWLLFLGVAALSACENQSRGFVLPEGTADTGKQVFLELNCNRCHTVDDIEWAGNERYDDPLVPLGGEVSSIKTYGELVTSVINPSHKIARTSLTGSKVYLVEGMSKMELYRYNEIMTVQELVDVVTYLQSQYELVRPENPYPHHGF